MLKIGWEFYFSFSFFIAKHNPESHLLEHFNSIPGEGNKRSRLHCGYSKRFKIKLGQQTG